MRNSPKKYFLNLFTALAILVGLQGQAFADYNSNYSAILSTQELKSQLAEIGYAPKQAAEVFTQFENETITTQLVGGSFALCGKVSLGFIISGGKMICTTLTHAYTLNSVSAGPNVGGSAGVFGIYFKSSFLKTTGKSCYFGFTANDVTDIGMAGGILTEVSCGEVNASRNPSVDGFLGFVGVAGGIEIGLSFTDATLYHYKTY